MTKRLLVPATNYVFNKKCLENEDLTRDYFNILPYELQNTILCQLSIDIIISLRPISSYFLPLVDLCINTIVSLTLEPHHNDAFLTLLSKIGANHLRYLDVRKTRLHTDCVLRFLETINASDHLRVYINKLTDEIVEKKPQFLSQIKTKTKNLSKKLLEECSNLTSLQVYETMARGYHIPSDFPKLPLTKLKLVRINLLCDDPYLFLREDSPLKQLTCYTMNGLEDFFGILHRFYLKKLKIKTVNITGEQFLGFKLDSIVTLKIINCINITPEHFVLILNKCSKLEKLMIDTQIWYKAFTNYSNKIKPSTLLRNLSLAGESMIGDSVEVPDLAPFFPNVKKFRSVIFSPKWDFKFFSNLVKIKVEDNFESTFELSQFFNCQSLTSLSLRSFEHRGELKVSHNTLKEFYLEGVNAKTINFVNCPKLEYLRISDMTVSEILMKEQSCPLLTSMKLTDLGKFPVYAKMITHLGKSAPNLHTLWFEYLQKEYVELIGKFYRSHMVHYTNKSQEQLFTKIKYYDDLARELKDTPLNLPIPYKRNFHEVFNNNSITITTDLKLNREDTVIYYPTFNRCLHVIT